MASLLVLNGPCKGERIELKEGRTLLGRGNSCDLVIDEKYLGKAAAMKESVSRMHAVIVGADGNFAIHDGDGASKKSRNGVYVNDKRIPYQGGLPLRNNDNISICDLFFAYHDGKEREYSVEVTVDHDSTLYFLHVQPAEKVRVILEITNNLSSSLAMDVLLPRIVDSLFELFPQADRGFLILRDEVTGALDLKAFQSRRSSDATNRRFSTRIVHQCLDKIQGILGNDLPKLFPASESIGLLPIHSLICAPLWSQEGKVLGALQLDSAGTQSRFTQEDLNLLMGIASQASIALSNARLHQEALLHQNRQQELDLARQVHRSLLPQGLPEVPGYDFYAYYQPAREIGGDYYDFIHLPGNRLAILLGDVAGKGVAAALVMVKFSVEARVCLEKEADLAAAISNLNALMVRASLNERFVSLVAMVLDPATHTVTMVNAGHPSPTLVRKQTNTVEEAPNPDYRGPLIGIMDNYQYQSQAVELQPGDGLFLFSDGITEAMNPKDQQFGPAGVANVLKSAKGSRREMGERLLQVVKQHAAGTNQADDIALVCFGRK